MLLLTLACTCACACDRSPDSTGGDLPLSLRLRLGVARRLSTPLSRERIEFQTDFLRTLKGGRVLEAFAVFAQAGSEVRCATERPDPAFLACFEGFDFPHLRLNDRRMTPAAPEGLLPACAPHLANCHDMVFEVDDRAGRELTLELGQVCRYRGRYWIFGKMSCSRRQSDSNR